MAKDGEFKQPYLYGEGKTALDTPMQAEIYSESPEMESQWKQPWLEYSYPKMEWEYAPPGRPGYPSFPGYPAAGPDCEVVGGAVGGGSTDPCDPGKSCGVWEFSCAHRIKSFSVVQEFGWIQSVQYFPNDTVRVTVCWNEGDRTEGRKVGPKAVLGNGQSVVSTADMSTCCPDKAVCTQACGQCPTLAISYTTQQMSLNDTQTLTASGGGGKYLWRISGGGGTLSKDSGPTTVYTAPATNAECALNPTIELKDCCGAIATLKIAVNGYSGADRACHYTYCVKDRTCTAPCGYYDFCCETDVNRKNFKCDNSALAEDDCGYQGYAGWGSCPADCGVYVSSCAVLSASQCGQTVGVVIDTRTAAMKTAGCCPATLL